MIVVNFKNYPQARGAGAVELALVCQEVSQKTNISIIPCPATVDIFPVARAVTIPVWAQAFDPEEDGKTTGWVTAAGIKASGASGSLVNHSEHPLSFDQIKTCASLAKQQNLKLMVLVKDLAMAERVDKLSPDYIGLEEPSLIGGKVAMSQLEEQREKIKKFTKLVKNATPTIGAGVNKESDIKASLALGAKGVLVASAVVLSLDPKKVLYGLARAFPTC